MDGHIVILVFAALYMMIGGLLASCVRTKPNGCVTVRDDATGELVRYGNPAADFVVSLALVFLWPIPLLVGLLFMFGGRQ